LQHEFTPVILNVLEEQFPKVSEVIFEQSPLLQYLNEKTRSAARGSKSRSSLGNIYAIYVLVENYINRGFNNKSGYTESEGARFSDLLQRQRELPFGSKLQNHHLNHRLNQEFAKFFPTVECMPILRDPKTKRYWINDNLLRVKIGRRQYNIAVAVKSIIDHYIAAKKKSFENFLADCQKMAQLDDANSETVCTFIENCLRPETDARIFEIVSFAVLHAHYGSQSVFWGWQRDSINEEALTLYKTGRTNANDGGIDFVMKPLGRFFQVTETIDARKYFLDIDKVQQYPITFVVKTTLEESAIRKQIKQNAKRVYSIQKIVDCYMSCIEEIINVPILLKRFNQIVKQGKLQEVIHEIVSHSKLEFNYPIK